MFTEESPVVLDAHVLDELSMLGRATMVEIFETFTRTGEERVRELGAAIARGDADGADAVCHSLRGSAAMVGASSLVGELDRLREQVVVDCGEASGAWRRVRDVFERVRGQIDELFPAP